MKVLLAIALFTFFIDAHTQSIVDQFGDDSASISIGAGGGEAPEIFKEKIQRISSFGRVLILTNTDQKYKKGDFISILIGEELAIRAITAKDTNEASGVKLTKIYNQALLKKFYEGMEVSVIRGDDSYYKIKRAKTAYKSKIEDEDNLFDESTLLEDDLTLGDERKGLIKNDNLVSASLGRIAIVDNDGEAASAYQFNVQWAYQLADNIFGEISFGQNLIRDFPDPGIDTKLSNFTVRGKYTFKAPLYSFIQPYIGFQIITADSPGAGEPDNIKTDPELDQEIELVESLEKSGIIFGITVLKRLVPGWFFRGDFGSDIVSGGLTLEF